MPDVPIRLYYHVTMIGKFVEITNEIFERVVSSGLYDKCDSISIGVLGDSDKLSELNNAISKFPKIKIVRHSENKGLFELFTIEELRNDCHNLDKFYAMYLHSKGVTSQNEADAKYRDDWRREMLSSVVDKYADCIEALNDGYDICGCRLVTARLSVSELTHASGNFWFANSQYIKTLPEIRTNQNSENPYPGAMYAEMWPFSGQPIIFCIDKMKYLRP